MVKKSRKFGFLYIFALFIKKYIFANINHYHNIAIKNNICLRRQWIKSADAVFFYLFLFGHNHKKIIMKVQGTVTFEHIFACYKCPHRHLPMIN